MTTTGALDRITRDPNIMSGRECVRGLRITVALLVNLVANGKSIIEILNEYPDLEEEDIHQTLQFAGRLAR